MLSFCDAVFGLDRIGLSSSRWKYGWHLRSQKTTRNPWAPDEPQARQRVDPKPFDLPTSFGHEWSGSHVGHPAKSRQYLLRIRGKRHRLPDPERGFGTGDGTPKPTDWNKNQDQACLQPSGGLPFRTGCQSFNPGPTLVAGYRFHGSALCHF